MPQAKIPRPIVCTCTSHLVETIGTASANFAKFRGIRPRMYIEDLL